VADEEVIDIPFGEASHRGLAIAHAITQVLRAGRKPVDVIDVRQSPEGSSWLVRLTVK